MLWFPSSGFGLLAEAVDKQLYIKTSLNLAKLTFYLGVSNPILQLVNLNSAKVFAGPEASLVLDLLLFLAISF